MVIDISFVSHLAGVALKLQKYKVIMNRLQEMVPCGRLDGFWW